MTAFAANSVLCRMALTESEGVIPIDAASFSTIRLLSGAVCLLLVATLRQKFSAALAGYWRPSKPNWVAVSALCAYMLCFSFAYQSLSAGTGALLLFGFVQLTMITTAIYRGERLPALAWFGLIIAGSGLVYLVSPGIEAPDPIYSGLMAIAGLAWGIYSLLGIRGHDPTSATANNFLYATPIAVLVSAIDFNSLNLTWQGCLLAVASGALASGMGYAIWYGVLQHIKTTTAAAMQLSVPAIATFGGVIFLAEPLNLRIVLATLLTIGGIALFLSRPLRSAA